MEIRIEKKPLAGILAHAAKVAVRKVNMTLLETVRLQALPAGRLVVSATDLEVGYTRATEAKITKPGVVCANAKAIADVVKAAPGDDLVLAMKGTVLEVRSGKSTWRLNTITADGFPELSRAGTEPAPAALDCGKHDLRVALRRVLHAVSEDETRHNLCGVYLEPLNEQVILVATDGHRMAKDELEVGSAPSKGGWLSAPMILPKKGVEELLRFLDENNGAGSLSVVGSSLVYSHEGARLEVRLIDGRFPAWREVWREGASVLTLDRARFLGTLRRMSILGDQTSAVKLQVEGGKVTLSRTDPDRGESLEEIEPARDVAFTARLGFSPLYMREACESFDGERVQVIVGDELHPILVRDEVSPHPGAHAAIIMPMRV